jgi:hypothetical protein
MPSWWGVTLHIKGKDMSEILILGTMRDPHVERVIREIEHLNGPRTVVLDHLASTETSFVVHADGRHGLQVAGHPIERPLIVWDRRKMIEGSILGFDPSDGGKQTATWRKNEWGVYDRMIMGIFGACVVNSIPARACLVKPYQQVLAAACGFAVPETLVANRKAPIADFIANRKAIIKSLSTAPMTSDDATPDKQSVIMTMAIPPDFLADAKEAQFSLGPHFVQQNVAKRYELRVVVIDQEVLPFRVLSQELEISKTDWRASRGAVPFEPWTVTDAVAAGLRRFMRLTGLFSGSFDLIVDPDERVWFLECNQDGQWGWLDNIVDGAIAKCFARAFVAKAEARRLCAGSVSAP